MGESLLREAVDQWTGWIIFQTAGLDLFGTASLPIPGKNNCLLASHHTQPWKRKSLSTFVLALNFFKVS